jgi:hypothetical protein
VEEFEDNRLIVNAMLDSHDAHMILKAKKSLVTSRCHLKPIREAFGHRQALSLRAKDFENYRRDRLKDVSQQTIDRELTLLRPA